MKLFVESRSGKSIVSGGVEVDDQASVADLKKAVHKARAKYYPSRQRYTLKPKAGDSGKPPALTEDTATLTSYGLADGSTVVFKDLGPQIGYRTVFVLEYLGPLVIYLLVCLLRGLIYPLMGVENRDFRLAPVQQLALAYHTFHYAKRILETIYIHKFRNATMPIFNLFRNSGYYWLAGAMLAYFINHPDYTPPSRLQTYVALTLALLFQAGNYRCHVILSNLRSDGSKGYKIPRGFLFDYITCPNYTCEVYAWLCFAAAVQSLAVILFASLGTYQMVLWAGQKHRRLVKTFNGKDGAEKYPKRFIMLPPVY